MPNTVVKLTNAESTWLEAAREDRKLLINKKHLQRCKCFFLVKVRVFNRINFINYIEFNN